MQHLKKRRVVIIDDRTLAREELNYLLATYHPDIEVAGDFSETFSALPIIESGKIDGVFLDINFEEQGEKAGLEFASRISRLPQPPWIIFVTGYPEHAIEAISIRPFGYITKPIDDFKLESALDKVRKSLPATGIKRQPIRIEVRHKIVRITENGHIERLFLNRFLLPDEILYIQSNSEVNSVKIHLRHGDSLDDVNIRLNSWLTDFDLPCFAQIRRNTIVNLKYVSGYKPDSERTEAYRLLFKDNLTELPIGANFFTAFREAIKRCGD